MQQRKNIRVGRRAAFIQLVRSAVPVAAVVTLGYSSRVDAQSTALWTGGGDGTSWNSSANWSTYPPTNDNLIFGGGPVGTINLQGNQTANSIDFEVGFTLGTAATSNDLSISTGSVTVDGVSAGINAILNGSHGLILTGTGSLTLTGANTYTAGTFINGGTLIADAASALSTGTVTIGTAGKLNVAGSLTAGGNYVNNGTVDVLAGQTLTFSNSSNTFIQNSGTLAVNGSLNMGPSNFTYNGGTITGTVGLGTNSSLPQLYLESSTVSSGTFVFTGEGGTLQGLIPITIPNGVTVTFQPTAASGSLNAFNALLNAGNLNIIGSATSTATMYLSSNTLTNTGTFTTSATGSPTVVSDFVYGSLNNTTGTVNINVSTTFNGSITNNGTFDIATGQTLTFSTLNTSTLTQNAGTLGVSGSLIMGGDSFVYNGGAVTGTVSLGTNSSLPQLYLESPTVSSGTFVFTGEGGTLQGPTPITIPNGVTITFQPTAASGSLNAFNALLNAGNLNIIGSATSTATMYLSSNTLTNTGTFTTSATGSPTVVSDFIYGSLNNTTGTVNINVSTTFNGSITNNGTFDIASGQTLTFSTLNTSTLTQNAGTLGVSGSLIMGGDSFVYNGGAVTGTVSLGTNSSLPQLYLESPTVSSGTFVFTGEGGTLQGPTPITIPNGVTITFQPTAASGSLNAFNALLNAGNLNIIGSATSTATMYLSSNTLTNTGTFTTSATGSPTVVSDFVYGSLNNTTGTVNINVSTTFNGSITNNGTFDIATGQTLTFSTLNTSTLTQNAGTLGVSGSLIMGGDSFVYNGGAVTGTVSLGTNSSLPQLYLESPTVSSGTFVFTGEGGTLQGPTPITIPNGVTITFQPTAASGSLNAFNALLNAGNLNIIGSATSTATMYLSSNTLTNTGTFTTSATGSPTVVSDFVYGSLNNTTGTVNINASTTFNGSITNNATFDIASGQTLSFTTLTTSTFTQNAGTLAVSGALLVGGNTFTDIGGTISGTVSIGSTTSNPTLYIGPGATGSGNFLLSGEGETLQSTSSSLAIPSGMNITFQPSVAGALKVFSSFTNAGTLKLVGSSVSSATVYFSSQTLTNTGTLNASVSGTSVATTDYIVGTLNNTTGTVNINQSTIMTGAVINNGTFDIADNQTFQFAAATGNSFTQNAGTLGINGTLLMAANTFYDNGGTITGTVTIGNASATPSIYFGPSAANSGTIDLIGIGASIQPNGGALTIPSGSTFIFKPNSTSAAKFMTNTTNAGNLNLIGTYSGGGGSGVSATVYLGTNTLTNTGTFTTSASGNPSGVVDYVYAAFNNTTGTVNLNAPTQFTGNVTNSGSFNIAAGAAMTFAGSPFSLTQSGGTFSIGAGDTLDLTSNALNLNGGTMTLAASTAPAVTTLKTHGLNFTGGAGTGTIADAAASAGQNPGLIDLGGVTGIFSVSAGTAPVQVLISAPITDGAVNKTGSGILELTGSNTYAGGTQVGGGELLVGSNTALGSGSVTISSGATLALAPGVQISAPITFSSTGLFDLSNDHLFISYAPGADPISSIAALIAAGYNGGTWNGATGITSSMAATNPSYGIGYADSADPNNPAGLATDTIEIAYTLLGDANLDDKVNGTDFTLMATHFNQSVTNGWDQGDFNYSNTVNGSDFLSLADNFNQFASQSSISAADLAALDSFAAANNISLSSVPEPTGGLILLVAAAGLLQTRARIRKTN